jgi:exodeoxyribonuclease-5
LDVKLKEMANEKNWNGFWKLKKYFHDIRHCYALTTHKHQGSTYQNIFIDVNDIYSNYDVEQRNKLLYVAMTRATDNVFFYDSRKIKK